jgi:hypothetical protein
LEEAQDKPLEAKYEPFEVPELSKEADALAQSLFASFPLCTKAHFYAVEVAMGLIVTCNYTKKAQHFIGLSLQGPKSA